METKRKTSERIASILEGFIRPWDLRKVTQQPFFTFISDCVILARTDLELRSWARQWINDLEMLVAHLGPKVLAQLLPSPGEILSLLKEDIWVFQAEFEISVSAALSIRCLIPKRMKLTDRASQWPEILDLELCAGSQWNSWLSLAEEVLDVLQAKRRINWIFDRLLEVLTTTSFCFLQGTQ